MSRSRLELSICIHRSTLLKDLDMDEILQICGKYGTVSTVSKPWFLFLNFQSIDTLKLGLCIEDLRKAGYSAEESRKNQKRKGNLGFGLEKPITHDSLLRSSEKESEWDSGQGEGSNSTASFSNILESGQCKNPMCLKITSFVCERCCDFFCSQECFYKEWSKHRYICFPMPKVIPIQNYADECEETTLLKTSVDFPEKKEVDCGKSLLNTFTEKSESRISPVFETLQPSSNATLKCLHEEYGALTLPKDLERHPLFTDTPKVIDDLSRSLLEKPQSPKQKSLSISPEEAENLFKIYYRLKADFEASLQLKLHQKWECLN